MKVGSSVGKIGALGSEWLGEAQELADAAGVPAEGAGPPP